MLADEVKVPEPLIKARYELLGRGGDRSHLELQAKNDRLFKPACACHVFGPTY